MQARLLRLSDAFFNGVATIDRRIDDSAVGDIAIGGNAVCSIAFLGEASS
jgi:hypothetical protein